MSESKSPRITRISWGKITVEGQENQFKDVKLFPGGAREWDWNETGTHHEPGIQVADVDEILRHGAKEIVLSKGFYERLQVCAETLEELKKKQIPVHVLETEKAANLYNQLLLNDSVSMQARVRACTRNMLR